MYLTDQQLIEVLGSTKVATAIHIGEQAIIQTANQAMLDVWDKDNSVIGKPLEDALPELSGQPFVEMFARVWREGITIAGTDTPAKLRIAGELQVIYFDFEYKAIKDDEGRTICILHTATDVSERFFSRVREQQLLSELAAMNVVLQAKNKDLEAINEEFAASNEELIGYQQKLQSLNSDLFESKTRFEFAIEAAELATWDYNPVTGHFSGNDRLKNWIGLPSEHTMTLAEAIASIAPEDFDKVKAAVQHALQNTSGGAYEVEYRIVNLFSDITRIVKAKGKARFDSSGQLTGLSGTLQDITEQIKREQYKDDFISIASHELKTPITSLQASLQLLGKLKEKVQPVIVRNLIEQSGKSMEKTSRLVEDLLNASRIGAGQLHLKKCPFDISRMLQSCCEHVRSAGRHELIFQGLLGLIVYADEHRVDQVIINMVNNAVKYAPDSKQIYLIAQQISGRIKVSVKDTGPGIAIEKTPHLFERYYRSDYAGVQFSGIGLGLYISAEIIRKHGGEIGVESEPGKGSTFWFTLPLGAEKLNNEKQVSV